MIPYIRGRVTLQAHVDIPEGLYEEEYGRSGFSGRYAHLYRSQPPVGWTRIEGPLRPRSFDLNALPENATDYLKARRFFLSNDDCRLGYCSFSQPVPYYFRNADADEIHFVHEGGGTLETDFGPLKYGRGDYLVIPRGTVYRFVPATATKLFLIESMSEVRLPERGMLGQHAFFDPAVIKVPTPEPGKGEKIGGEYELKIQRMGELTSVFYPFCPINTEGWKGNLTVWQLNIADIRPVICERYHLPPSAHTTFVAENFVVCTFLPRGLETEDPKAMKVPFFHSNIDYDEVLFYHDGEFFSRTGIAPGMVTFHPQGIHHGPQQGAIERSRAATKTNEVAIMVDTRRPLNVERIASEVENPDYWKSWSHRE